MFDPDYDLTQYKSAIVYGIFSRGLVHGTKAWASPSQSAHGQASLGKKIWLVFSQLVNPVCRIKKLLFGD